MNIRILINVGNETSPKWEELEVGEDQDIALSFRTLESGQLDSRFSGGSNQIKLPRTDHNVRILGFPAHPLQAQSERVHTRFLPCVVYVSGVQVCDSLSKMLVQRMSGNSIFVEIYHGNFDIFRRLGEKKLTEIKGYEPIRRDNVGVTLSWENEDVVIPLMDWNMEDEPDNQLQFGASTNFQFKINALTLIPFIPFDPLVKNMFSELGYSARISIDSNEYYKNAAFSLAGRKIIVSKVFPFTSWVQSVNPLVMELEDPRYPELGDIINLPQSGQSSGDYTFQNRDDFIVRTSRVAGWYRIKAILCPYNNEQANIRIGYHGTTTTLWSHTTSVCAEFDREVHIDGKDVFFTVGCRNGYINNMKFSVELIEADISMSDPDTKYLITENMPADWTYLDLVIEYFKMFALIPYVDNINKEVYFYNIDEVYKNKDKAYDWSDKIQDMRPDIELHNTDMAQNNWIAYKEIDETAYDEDGESRTEKVSDKYPLSIGDETLQRNKDMISLEFAPSTVLSGFYWMKARELRGGDLEDDEEKSLRVCNLSKKPIYGGVLLKNTPLDRTDISEITTDSGMFAGFNDIGSYILEGRFYNGLHNMLNKGGMITELVYLTPYDLANFKNYIPVYIKKYSKFFFVSSINNYRDGKLTKVDMYML